MRVNPFQKYLTKEDTLQQVLGNYIMAQYPGVLFFAVPNASRKTKFEQYKAKVTHLKAGVPDLVICYPSGVYHGLFLELKTETGKPSPAQKQWLNDLSNVHYRAVIAYGFDEAKKIIDDYLKCGFKIKKYHEL